MKKFYIIILLAFSIILLCGFKEININFIKTYKLPDNIKITEFSDIYSNKIYTPEIKFGDNNYNKVIIKEYNLEENLLKKITIETKSIDFPIIKVSNNKIFFVDYDDHTIKSYNEKGEFINTINIEDDYQVNSGYYYPSEIMPLIINDDNIIINNVFSKDLHKVQIYNMKGNLKHKFATIPSKSNTLYNSGSIYCIYYNSVEVFDEKGKIKDIIELEGDNFNQYSKYVFYKDFFIAIGSKYLMIYNNSFTDYKRITLKRLLKKEINLENIKLLSSNNYLYILNIDDNEIYKLEII